MTFRDYKNYRAADYPPLREPNGVWAVIVSLGVAALALFCVVVILSMGPM